MDEKTILKALGLEPAEAVRFLEEQGVRVPADWEKLRDKAAQEAKNAVDKLKLDLTQDARDKVKEAKEKFDTWKKRAEDLIEETDELIKEAVANGGSERDFVKAMEKNLEEKGLYQRKSRLRLIYETQVSTAYSAGRWQAIEEAKAFAPYLQYHCSMLPTSRDPHKDLNKKVYPANDPIWNSIMPPNGFRCKCWVTQLTERGLSRKKVTPLDSADTPEAFNIPDKGWKRNPGKEVYKPSIRKYDPALQRRSDLDV